MYNSDTPLRAELPTSRQLVRSTIFAAVSAGVLLVAVVLPSEYGMDPTGIGQVLRLTEMGEIKQQLADDAKADAKTKADSIGAAPGAMEPPAKSAPVAAIGLTTPPIAQNPVPDAKLPVTSDTAKVQWRDETPFTLAPGQGTEIKLVMEKGAKARYLWAVEGGELNFDTHGDAFAKSISYEKGRGVATKEGVLEAAFTGNHGWYWRNRGKAEVKVVLRTTGEYTAIKK